CEPSEPVPRRGLRTGSQAAPHAEPFLSRHEPDGSTKSTAAPRSNPRGRCLFCPCFPEGLRVGGRRAGSGQGSRRERRGRESAARGTAFALSLLAPRGERRRRVSEKRCTADQRVNGCLQPFRGSITD